MTYQERARSERARAEAAFFAADGDGAMGVARKMAIQAGHLGASLLILAIDADLEIEALRAEIAKLKAKAGTQPLRELVEATREYLDNAPDALGNINAPRLALALHSADEAIAADDGTVTE